MASLKFSLFASDICEPRKCNPFNFEFCPVEFLGYNSQVLHVCRSNVVHGKSVMRRTGLRCFGLFIEHREEESSNGLDSAISPGGILRSNSSPFVKLKHIKVVGLEGPAGSYPVSELVEECKSDEGTDGASNCNIMVPKNAVSHVVEIQKQVLSIDVGRKIGRKMWRRLVTAKREVPGDIPVSVHPKRARFKFVQEDSDLKAYLTAIGPQTTLEHCNSILKLLDQNSNEKALNFFAWMRSNGKLMQNVTAYIVALKVLVRREDWETVESLLQEMTYAGCELNCQIFNKLILVCSKRGIVKMGSKLFHMMLDKGIQPNIATFGMLMTLYQKSGHLSEAEFAFNQMRSCKMRCVTAYSAMITIYTRVRQYDKSEGIIGIMDKDEVRPNLENWLVRINTYSQQGKLGKAKSILNSMRESGTSPNIVAYNTLITGYGKISDTDAARRLFQRLRGLGLAPDETTYRSMIEGYGRADNYVEAKRYYEELKRLGFHPSSSNFYTMINLQARHGDENGSVQTLKDMRLLGCQYSSILTTLLQAYGRVGRVHKIPFVLKSSFYENILADQTSCAILVMAYVQSSLLDDALGVLRERKWKDYAYEDNLYHLSICSCKEASNYENAIIIFKQMLELNKDPNLHIMSSMIDIYGCMGRFQEAEDLYLKLKASGITLDMVAYSILVRMYVKAGSLKDACSVLDMMEKQKDITPDTFLYRDMLRIYQRCGMLEKLAEVYYRMLKSGLTWDEAMYNCVINCCAHALPVDEVSRLFDEMLQHGYTASTITLNAMLDIFGKAGLLKKARKLFSMARKQGLADVISYNTIIAAYGQTKNFTSMQSVVQQMQNAGYPVSLEAYNCMLDAYGKEGQLEKFNNVLKKMKEARCDPDHYTYNILINIYGRKGWIEEVAKVLTELRGRGLEPDLYSYNTLIKVFGIAGMVEEAVHIVKEMRTKGMQPDRMTYASLVSALQRNEAFLEAVKWSLWMKQMGLLC
uniref:Pentatricopeptide repeat-containing protein At4g30825, chloroplastic n=1 Tax=Anthurium amnicola TaxID=1678845 RepID=A0A1D1Z7T4_9ARAE